MIDFAHQYMYGNCPMCHEHVVIEITTTPDSSPDYEIAIKDCDCEWLDGDAREALHMPKHLRTVSQ